MVGKRSGKALLREEGLQRTDNGLELTNWPQVSMINQKNYYTEYLRRDDQILSLRVLQDERRNQMTTDAKDKDRARAQGKDDNDTKMDVDDDEEGNAEDEEDLSGAKVVVIHPGSQNMRIGFANEPMPKTVPMCIARKAKQNEAEEQGEPSPKRLKLDDGSFMEPEKMFGPEFATTYNKMCQDLKVQMRANKRRVLPNSKELVVNYNSRTEPEIISEHNDPLRVEWTPVPSNAKEAPDFYTGMEALRVPDESEPRYKLTWPMQRGWYNEAAYSSKATLLEDWQAIIENALIKELNLTNKREWPQYSVVFIVPDLYERNYVTETLEMLIRDIGFGRVCFIQESLAATFGAGFTTSCVVDIGAQKTSICCVEEGMCVENSRVNLKMGGADVTDTFMRMMLFDHFPYDEINLKRRYDLLLADEIKEKHLTMNETEISVQLYDFHVRAPSQDTRKYQFKTYDEVILPVSGLFQPSLFDNSRKLDGRRKFIGLSTDLYDGSINDPTSNAQSDIINEIAPAPPAPASTNGEAGSTPQTTAAPVSKPAPSQLSRLQESETNSQRNSPAPEGDRETPAPGAEEKVEAPPELPACLRDDVLPIMGLDSAILTSITHGSKGDERRMRDFLLGIMVIGGGAQVQGFLTVLEERLKVLAPRYAKDITVGPPPRELDPQGVIWKGGSVCGKLRSMNEMWIGKLEFDRLGARCLAYKCLWAW